MTTASLSPPTDFVLSNEVTSVSEIRESSSINHRVNLESALPISHGSGASMANTNILTEASTSVKTDRLEAAVALAFLLAFSIGSLLFSGLLAAGFYSSVLRYSSFDIIRLLSM